MKGYPTIRNRGPYYDCTPTPNGYRFITNSKPCNVAAIRAAATSLSIPIRVSPLATSLSGFAIPHLVSIHIPADTAKDIEFDIFNLYATRRRNQHESNSS